MNTNRKRSRLLDLELLETRWNPNVAGGVHLVASPAPPSPQASFVTSPLPATYFPPSALPSDYFPLSPLPTTYFPLSPLPSDYFPLSPLPSSGLLPSPLPASNVPSAPPAESPTGTPSPLLSSSDVLSGSPLIPASNVFSPSPLIPFDGGSSASPFVPASDVLSASPLLPPSSVFSSSPLIPAGNVLSDSPFVPVNAPVMSTVIHLNGLPGTQPSRVTTVNTIRTAAGTSVVTDVTTVDYGQGVPDSGAGQAAGGQGTTPTPAAVPPADIPSLGLGSERAAGPLPTGGDSSAAAPSASAGSPSAGAAPESSPSRGTDTPGTPETVPASTDPVQMPAGAVAGAAAGVEQSGPMGGLQANLGSPDGPVQDTISSDAAPPDQVGMSGPSPFQDVERKFEATGEGYGQFSDKRYTEIQALLHLPPLATDQVHGTYFNFYIGMNFGDSPGDPNAVQVEAGISYSSRYGSRGPWNVFLNAPGAPDDVTKNPQQKQKIPSDVLLRLTVDVKGNFTFTVWNVTFDSVGNVKETTQILRPLSYKVTALAKQQPFVKLMAAVRDPKLASYGSGDLDGNMQFFGNVGGQTNYSTKQPLPISPQHFTAYHVIPKVKADGWEHLMVAGFTPSGWLKTWLPKPRVADSTDDPPPVANDDSSGPAAAGSEAASSAVVVSSPVTNPTVAPPSAGPATPAPVAPLLVSGAGVAGAQSSAPTAQATLRLPVGGNETPAALADATPPVDTAPSAGDPTNPKPMDAAPTVAPVNVPGASERPVGNTSSSMWRFGTPGEAFASGPAVQTESLVLRPTGLANDERDVCPADLAMWFDERASAPGDCGSVGGGVLAAVAAPMLLPWGGGAPGRISQGIAPRPNTAVRSSSRCTSE